MLRFDIFLIYGMQIWKGEIKGEKDPENIQNIKKSQEDIITSKTNTKHIKNIKKEDF